MKRLTTVGTVIAVLAIFLIAGCTKTIIQKRDAKAANTDQNISACADIIPNNMSELTAAGQAAIGDAVDRCVTLILIQQGK